MKIIIPGGSGQIGQILARHLHAQGHDILVLSRSPALNKIQPAPWRTAHWNGLTPGPWVAEFEDSDAVIHLSGRSVNCRYNAANRKAIYESRTLPTLLLGKVIANLQNPPRLWLNASTSTIYRHALDRPQDEYTGDYARRTNGPPTQEQPNLPETWSFSADVAQQWEEALAATPTPRTCKIRLRSSMVMSPNAGGVFSVMSMLTRLGLGGTQGPGTQYVSWMHGDDYARAIDLLLTRPEIADDTNGIVNMTAPGPLPNRDFQRALRRAWRVPIGLPAATWMLEIGARIIHTETELILKSRRVTPAVLLKHGFQFQHPTWPKAATDLATKMLATRE